MSEETTAVAEESITPAAQDQPVNAAELGIKFLGRKDGIKLALIKEPPTRLREAMVTTTQFLDLVESVKQAGVINPIVVRPDPNGAEGEYELIDGTQRYTASQHAGRHDISVSVYDANDDQVRILQIMLNTQGVKQNPTQVGLVMKKMLNERPDLSVAEFSRIMSKSEKWVRDRLDVSKLPEKVQQLVDANEITLINGVILSRLPEDQIDGFVDRAINEAAATFVPSVNKVINDIKANNKTSNKSDTFVPRQVLRKKDDVVTEFDILTGAKQGTSQLLKAAQAADPDASKETLAFAVAWMLKFDTASKEAQEAKWKADRAQAKAKADAAKARREEEKRQREQDALQSVA